MRLVVHATWSTLHRVGSCQLIDCCIKAIDVELTERENMK